MADIVPVFKTGDKLQPTNYRPIALISNIAKILEKIIHTRLYKFFNNKNLLSKRQFGFKRKIGTRDAHDFVVNNIINGIEKDKKVIGTFLDLAKAFDTVNHDILLKKLDRYGVRGISNDLLKSYLHNRSQKTKIDKIKSINVNVSVGVPQGTILGPLLFSIYINDLIDNLPEGSICSYADDTVIFSIENNWFLAEKQMNLKLAQVYKWLNLNQLSLNTSKTVYIAFGSYFDSVPGEMNINVNNMKLTRVENCKYLGLYLDSRLKWNKHIEHITNRTKYLIYVIAKLANYMNVTSLMTIYYALFHSIGTYGIIAWGGAYDKEISQIQRIQNRILKLILKKTTAISHPLTIKQCFLLESITYNFVELANKYLESKSITRNKLIITDTKKTIKLKSSKIVALKIFHKFDRSFITLVLKLQNKKFKFKSWLLDNTKNLISLNLLTPSDISDI